MIVKNYQIKVSQTQAYTSQWTSTPLGFAILKLWMFTLDFMLPLSSTFLCSYLTHTHNPPQLTLEKQIALHLSSQLISPFRHSSLPYHLTLPFLVLLSTCYTMPVHISVYIYTFIYYWLGSIYEGEHAGSFFKVNFIDKNSSLTQNSVYKS